MHVKHRNDPVYTDGAFHHTGKKTVAFEVVQPVNIQLAAYELMKKFAMIAVSENF